MANQKRPSISQAARSLPAASASAGKTKSNAKPDGAQKAAVTEQLSVADIPLDQIVVMPGNPRKTFDQAELAKLAVGIANDGQIQPGCVRPLDNGEGFELFVGERRFRACGLAGVKTFRATIHKISRAKAIELRGFENEDRADFNEIERAIWYQQMLDDAGFTQQKLADRLRISQGEVSNTVRLLKLPDAWQQRVILREIPVVDARFLIPWLDLSDVVKKVETDWKQAKKNGWRTELSGIVKIALRDLSKPMKGSFWDHEKHYEVHVRIKPTPSELAELNVRDVPDHQGTEARAFNVQLWKKLQSAAENKHKAAEAKKAGKTAEQSAKQLTPKEKAEQFEKRLYRYKIGWLQDQIAKRVDQVSEADLIKWLLGLAMNGGHGSWGRSDVLKEVAPNVGLQRYDGDDYEHGDRLEWILAFDDDRMTPLLREMFRSWCEVPPRSWSSDAHPKALESLASSLGVDLELHWRVDQDFLNLHTIDQLDGLEKEWKLKTGLTSKAAKVKEILAADQQNPLPAPKSLTRVKACHLD